jgi:hypothetical protein
MQISAGPPPKRARAKASEESAKLPIVTTKKPRARKPAQAEMLAGAPVAVVATQASGEDLSGLIATTAYFIAAERNFTAGRELEDWLEAERRVRGG